MIIYNDCSVAIGTRVMWSFSNKRNKYKEAFSIMYQFKPATERIQQQRELIRDRVVRYDAERGRIMTEAYQKYEHVIPIIKRPPGPV